MFRKYRAGIFVDFSTEKTYEDGYCHVGIEFVCHAMLLEPDRRGAHLGLWIAKRVKVSGASQML